MKLERQDIELRRGPHGNRKRVAAFVEFENGNAAGQRRRFAVHPEGNLIADDGGGADQ